MNKIEIKYLDKIKSPKDLDDLNDEQLKELAKELRYDVIETVSKTGGHLGASLGVIELTVALHKIFDSPKDKIIWDVGHQSYPHKILTGRRGQMSTLRKKDGFFLATSNNPTVMTIAKIRIKCMTAVNPNIHILPTHKENVIHHIHAKSCITKCLT